MLQIPTPDDQRRARLALLTDKERECLPEVVLVNRKTGQPGDFASGLGQAFDRLDKDNNDLLEGSEITSAHFRVVRAPSAQAAPGASGTTRSLVSTATRTGVSRARSFWQA